MSLVSGRKSMKLPIPLLLSACILLSGCLDSVNDTVNPERELFDDNTFIDEDDHIKLTWEVDSVVTVRLNLEVLEGPNIDLYTMTEINYEKYENCESFVYLADLSDPNTASSNLETNVDSGTYITVIDNTDCGDAQPPDQGGLISQDENDEARVDYRLTAQ